MCVTDPRVAALVSAVINLGFTSFWHSSARSFRDMLSEFLRFFSLHTFGFTAYSFRRGGASYAFSTGVTFDELLVRGRWQNSRTARVY